jgi:hypothetical protein
MSFDGIDVGKHWPFVVLIGIVAAVVTILIRKSRDRHSKINLEDLLLDEYGKLSPSRCVLIGSFVLTSWGMMFMWLNSKMTEGYFGAYLAAWVIPAVSVVMKGKSPGGAAEIDKGTQQP